MLASFPLVRKDVKDQPASLGVTCGQHIESPPVIVGSLDQECTKISNYRNLQIPRDAGLAPVHITGDRTRNHFMLLTVPKGATPIN